MARRKRRGHFTWPMGGINAQSHYRHLPRRQGCPVGVGGAGEGIGHRQPAEPDQESGPVQGPEPRVVDAAHCGDRRGPGARRHRRQFDAEGQAAGRGDRRGGPGREGGDGVMAASTGIILTAGVITFGNEWLQKGTVNFRVAAATLGSPLVFAGLEKLDQQAAVGLASIVMITVLIGGVSAGYKSPAAEVLSLIGAKS